MSNSSKHRQDDKDISRLIELFESEGRQIEDSFEDVDKLSRRVERLSEQILGLRK